MKIYLKKKKLDEWQQWFAWYPVILEDDSYKRIVWLENIFRSKRISGFKIS